MEALPIVVFLLLVTVVLVASYRSHEKQRQVRIENRRNQERRMTEAHKRAIEFENEIAAEWPVFHKDSGEWNKEYLMMSANQARLRRVKLRVNPDLAVVSDSLIDVSDIVSVEIQRSATTVMKLDMQTATKKRGGITRAVVGGLVAGPAGAIVGAGTASTTTTGSLAGTQTTSYGPIDLVIGTTDLHVPLVKMRMLSMSSAEDWLHRIRGAIAVRGRAT